ncbi:MAG: GTPase ObgE [Firmicutes bacterium]|nr:GTPase ObgE [Bacillota bacterium]
MFVDRVKVFVRGGKGGNGAVSFRREKNVPRGGPDGGDGGDGGEVVFVASAQKNTLIDLSYRPHLYAADGFRGQGKNRQGKSGAALYVKVPVGTIIKDENGTILADLHRGGIKAVAARGGKGGRGNTRFTTSRRRVPDFAENGEPGEKRTLILELKLLADVGLVGFPNAGKSTFLSRVSAAKPKIADFPFTTLVPQLGVVYLGDERSFVIADLPGIIEGAHKGAGLGHQFLKHIERTEVLLYIIDAAGTEGRDPYSDFYNLQKELKLYNEEMLGKPFILAANKIDLPQSEEHLKKLRDKVKDIPLFPISAVTGAGIDLLLEELYRGVQAKKALIPEEEDLGNDVIFLPPLEKRPLHIRLKGNVYFISGDEVEKAALRADFNSTEGLRRFQERINRLGVERELVKMGIQEGDTVCIGDMEFTYSH